MSKIYQKTHPAGKNAGFTLIELLVVVLIIGILAAVALPQYQKAVEKSRAAQALSLLKSFAQAFQSYYMANGEYPTTFDQLDLEMNWTGTEKWGSRASDTRSNGEWSLQIIDDSGNHGVYVGRLQGEFKGGGFGFYAVSPGSGFETNAIVCLERKSLGVVFEKNPGDYCQKLFHATPRQNNSNALRDYSMP